MIKDNIQIQSEKTPNKIFMTIEGINISYSDFETKIHSIQSYLSSLNRKPLMVAIDSMDAIFIFASIIACNRRKTIPIIMPPEYKDKKVPIFKYINFQDFCPNHLYHDT